MIVFDGFELITLGFLVIAGIGLGLIWLWNKTTDKIDKYFEKRHKDE